MLDGGYMPKEAEATEGWERMMGPRAKMKWGY